MGYTNATLGFDAPMSDFIGHQKVQIFRIQFIARKQNFVLSYVGAGSNPAGFTICYVILRGFQVRNLEAKN